MLVMSNEEWKRKLPSGSNLSTSTANGRIQPGTNEGAMKTALALIQYMARIQVRVTAPAPSWGRSWRCWASPVRS